MAEPVDSISRGPSTAWTPSGGEAYSGLATFEVESTDGEVTVHVSGLHPDVHGLVDHFANHVPCDHHGSSPLRRGAT